MQESTVHGSSVHGELTEAAARLAAVGERPAAPCPDPVNAAMIRNWTQALGDPGGWDGVAPPAMIQVWSMQGLAGPRQQGGSVADEPLRLLNEGGYGGVVATNCEQTYDRYVKVGERLRSTMRFGGVAGPKKTGMGEGYFVTWYQTWYDENDERVAEMMFRVLKFQPRKRPDGAAGPAKGGGGKAGKGGKYPLQPAIGPDTAFFWDGVNNGELRVQSCDDCGALRHPPGPMCPSCHSTARGYVVASGRGEVHSYVVHHHPPVPGRTPPYVVAVVELEEGVRIVGNVLGCPPEDVTVGMPVRLVFERMDDDLTLPQWTPAGAPPPQEEPEPGPGTAEGGLEIELTPTFVISTALATRDFTPVHHDPGLARAQGSKDIFLNILTTMGLVQRYVLETVPGAELAGIEVRLGVPAYAGDTLRLTGERVDEHTLTVRGAVSLGDHVTATVRLKAEER
ncbi:OB-fold domain-containing protein [Actinomadura xylanilytica]|uniref:OB-fold domain-containing protein n=1 Tax=Actinomadura xylanilytica TaxID=887459 RepID=UPI00255AED7B|nr:OB-fold domain-containing protein [Actinomadura xylanilytica]MDL4771837.1 OB-fold domain-containing protein [Actinomadura xylanilytica]